VQEGDPVEPGAEDGGGTVEAETRGKVKVKVKPGSPADMEARAVECWWAAARAARLYGDGVDIATRAKITGVREGKIAKAMRLAPHLFQVRRAGTYNHVPKLAVALRGSEEPPVYVREHTENCRLLAAHIESVESP
jgi:hypothetical protein